MMSDYYLISDKKLKKIQKVQYDLNPEYKFKRGSSSLKKPIVDIKVREHFGHVAGIWNCNDPSMTLSTNGPLVFPDQEILDCESYDQYHDGSIRKHFPATYKSFECLPGLKRNKTTSVITPSFDSFFSLVRTTDDSMYWSDRVGSLQIKQTIGDDATQKAMCSFKAYTATLSIGFQTLNLCNSSETILSVMSQTYSASGGYVYMSTTYPGYFLGGVVMYGTAIITFDEATQKYNLNYSTTDSYQTKSYTPSIAGLPFAAGVTKPYGWFESSTLTGTYAGVGSRVGETMIVNDPIIGTQYSNKEYAFTGVRMGGIWNPLKADNNYEYILGLRTMTCSFSPIETLKQEVYYNGYIFNGVDVNGNSWSCQYTYVYTNYPSGAYGWILYPNSLKNKKTGTTLNIQPYYAIRYCTTLAADEYDMYCYFFQTSSCVDLPFATMTLHSNKIIESLPTSVTYQDALTYDSTSVIGFEVARYDRL